MSVAALTAAWKVECEPLEKLVLLALADHANDETYECWPSLTHLCRKTGLARSTMAKCLKSLEDNRWIGRTKRGTNTTKYRLNVPNWSASRTSARGELVRETDGGSPRDEPPLVRETDGGSPRDGHGTVIEPSVEPSVNQKRATLRCPEYLSQSVWDDYLKHRKQLKAPLTETAWKPIEKSLIELRDSDGLEPDDVLAEAMSAGWRGLKAQWVRNRLGAQRSDGQGERRSRRQLTGE